MNIGLRLSPRGGMRGVKISIPVNSLEIITTPIIANTLVSMYGRYGLFRAGAVRFTVDYLVKISFRKF